MPCIALKAMQAAIIFILTSNVIRDVFVFRIVIQKAIKVADEYQVLNSTLTKEDQKSDSVTTSKGFMWQFVTDG